MKASSTRSVGVCENEVFSVEVCTNSNFSSLNAFLPSTRVLRRRTRVGDAVGAVGVLGQLEVADAQVVAVLGAALVLGAQRVAGAERLLHADAGVDDVVGPAHLIARTSPLGRGGHDRLRVVRRVALDREASRWSCPSRSDPGCSPARA